MRLRIELEDTLVAAVDEIAGHRQRSAFVREAVRAAVEHHKRWRLISQARKASRAAQLEVRYAPVTLKPPQGTDLTWVPVWCRRSGESEEVWTRVVA